MMRLLAPDWRAQLQVEKERASAALMAATAGPDWRLVDERLLACDWLREIEALATEIEDRLALMRARTEA